MTDEAVSPCGVSHPGIMTYDRPTLETYGTVHEQTQTYDDYPGSVPPKEYDA